MQAVLRNLVWVQWRELRGIAALLSAVVVCQILYGVSCERTTGVPVAVASWSGFGGSLYMALAGTLVAMRIVAGESTAGIASFVAAWPVSAPRRAAVRLAAGLATLAVPLVLGGLLLSALLAAGVIAQPEPRSVDNPHTRERSEALWAMLKGTGPAFSGLPWPQAMGVLWTLTAFVLLDTVAFCALLCVLTARFRRESRIALAGVLLMIAQVLVMAVHEGMKADDELPARQWVAAAYAAATVRHWGYGESTTGRSFADLEFLDRPWLTMLLRSATLALCCGAYLMRAPRSVRATAAADAPRAGRWRGPHWPLPRSRCGALVWWHWQEGFGLALAGLVLSAAITASALWLENFGADLPAYASWSQRAASAQRGVLLMFSAVWAVVVAVGLFAGDLQPRLLHFWRARPVSLEQWFWGKYAIGVVLVLLVLDGLPLLLQALVADEFMADYTSRWACLAVAPPWHGMAYSIAVACVCYFRNATWGGVAAVALGFALLVGASSFPATCWLEPIRVFNDLSTWEGRQFLARFEPLPPDQPWCLSWSEYFRWVLPVWTLLGAGAACAGWQCVARGIQFQR